LRNKAADSTIILDDAASEVSSSSIHDFSEIPESILDRPDFDAQKYIKEVLETQTLEELLKTYNGVLGDIRALDAEKKALVYDNYSKLIVATETIRRMRERMGPLGPMAGTLDPAVERIWERVEEIKGALRGALGEEGRVWLNMTGDEREGARRRERERKVVLRVLDTPGRLRELVDEGRVDEARREWGPVLKCLERWKERAVGGDDVQACIDEGVAALRGERTSEKSKVKVQMAESR